MQSGVDRFLICIRGRAPATSAHFRTSACWHRHTQHRQSKFDIPGWSSSWHHSRRHPPRTRLGADEGGCGEHTPREDRKVRRHACLDRAHHASALTHSQPNPLQQFAAAWLPETDSTTRTNTQATRAKQKAAAQACDDSAVGAHDHHRLCRTQPLGTLSEGLLLNDHCERKLKLATLAGRAHADAPLHDRVRQQP